MLVEPPGQDLPPGSGLTSALIRRLPLAAAAAAIVLAVLSRGDALVLGALLLLAAWRDAPRPWLRVASVAGAVGPALLAAAWRWGSTSLEALAGNQAVLGPAGWTGSGPLVAASWLAAVAIVGATPRWRRTQVGSTSRPARPLVAGRETSGSALGRKEGSWRSFGALDLASGVAFGTTAAVVVAGPAAGDRTWVRVLATVVAVALALLVSRYRPSGGAFGLLAVASSLAGVTALALVASAGPTLRGIVDVSEATSGAVIASSVLVAVLVASLAWGLRRRLPSPAPSN